MDNATHATKHSEDCGASTLEGEAKEWDKKHSHIRPRSRGSYAFCGKRINPAKCQPYNPLLHKKPFCPICYALHKQSGRPLTTV